jgi:hypothetical protein
MMSSDLAIVYPGDRDARDQTDTQAVRRASRFADLFDALAQAGVRAEPAIYRDEWVDEVRAQLLRVRVVLVWHNPIEAGRTRSVLNAMLRDVASHGIHVSAHPNTIAKLGTKDVLLAVRDTAFGSDVERVSSLEELQRDLPARLERGPRVLKQHHGHSGLGVWRIERKAADRYALLHAQRGSLETTVDFEGVVRALAPYFDQGAAMIDQAWQPRIAEGMVRAYLVGDRVAGFGHQALNALVPATQGQPAPTPGPRLYSSADDARFQDLRQRLESQWVATLCAKTSTPPESLPLLWDADFMWGERLPDEPERHVLCEINVSSVSPFPDAAIPQLVHSVRSVLTKSKR